MNELLHIENLHISFQTKAGELKAVRGVSLTLEEGEMLALVGESGCGKSVTAQSILRLNPSPPCIMKEGTLHLCQRDILNASEKDMRRIRGNLASIIFQDPMSSLNPTMKIGKQISEVLHLHQKLSRDACYQETLRLLEMVKISDTSKRYHQYPHQLSGGMRQRVMIAIALACKPKLLIADEPTTALDVTIQTQIIHLLAELQRELGMGVILITHDLSLAASFAKRIAVMYAGKIVETGPVEDIFAHPAHPYTKALLDSLPSYSHNRQKRLNYIPGMPPDLMDPLPGCAFAERCSHAAAICSEATPPETFLTQHHSTLCHFPTLFESKEESS